MFISKTNGACGACVWNLLSELSVNSFNSYVMSWGEDNMKKNRHSGKHIEGGGGGGVDWSEVHAPHDNFQN